MGSYKVAPQYGCEVDQLRGYLECAIDKVDSSFTYLDDMSSEIVKTSEGLKTRALIQVKCSFVYASSL